MRALGTSLGTSLGHRLGPGNVCRARHRRPGAAAGGRRPRLLRARQPRRPVPRQRAGADHRPRHDAHRADRPHRHLGRLDVRVLRGRLWCARQGRRADAARARGVVRPRRGIRVPQRRARRPRPHPVDRRHAGDDDRAARRIAVGDRRRLDSGSAGRLSVAGDGRTGLSVARPDRGRCPAGGIRLGAAQAARRPGDLRNRLEPAGRAGSPAFASRW